MTIATRPLTYDDLLSTPDDRNRYEILNGRMVVSPAPTSNHQLVAGRIYMALTNTSSNAGDGIVFFAPLDVRLGPHDIVEPDLLFVTSSRRHIIEKAYLTAAPDLLVEILSPSSGRRDRGEKMALYASHGVREYWLADPEAKALVLLALVDHTFERVDPDERGHLRSTVLTDLVIDPDDLFTDLL
ncbi:MAG: Uma2 family endonuclease [Thermomicrobiales bacterium]